MKVRPLLYLTAIGAAILGATVVYLVLSVPNDLRADALLKAARQEMTDGNHAKARESLSTIIHQYPRTDAAAAATVALSSLAQQEREDLARAIGLLRQQNEQQSRLIADLQKSIKVLQTPPPPPPVTIGPPAPAPAPAKVAPAKKKTTPRKKTTTRRRRR